MKANNEQLRGVETDSWSMADLGTHVFSTQALKKLHTAVIEGYTPEAAGIEANLAGSEEAREYDLAFNEDELRLLLSDVNGLNPNGRYAELAGRASDDGEVRDAQFALLLRARHKSADFDSYVMNSPSTHPYTNERLSTNAHLRFWGTEYAKYAWRIYQMRQDPGFIKHLQYVADVNEQSANLAFRQKSDKNVAGHFERLKDEYIDYRDAKTAVSRVEDDFRKRAGEQASHPERPIVDFIVQEQGKPAHDAVNIVRNFTEVLKAQAYFSVSDPVYPTYQNALASERRATDQAEADAESRKLKEAAKATLESQKAMIHATFQEQVRALEAERDADLLIAAQESFQAEVQADGIKLAKIKELKAAEEAAIESFLDQDTEHKLLRAFIQIEEAGLFLFEHYTAMACLNTSETPRQVDVYDRMAAYAILFAHPTFVAWAKDNGRTLIEAWENESAREVPIEAIPEEDSFEEAEVDPGEQAYEDYNDLPTVELEIPEQTERAVNNERQQSSFKAIEKNTEGVFVPAQIDYELLRHPRNTDELEYGFVVGREVGRVHIALFAYDQLHKKFKEGTQPAEYKDKALTPRVALEILASKEGYSSLLGGKGAERDEVFVAYIYSCFKPVAQQRLRDMVENEELTQLYTRLRKENGLIKLWENGHQLQDYFK